jgi:hypothetical protein
MMVMMMAVMTTVAVMTNNVSAHFVLLGSVSNGLTKREP